jgi:nucleoid-associated protein YejK
MKGWTAVAVAAELNVTEETARRYRQEYLDKIKQQAQANPSMLVEVLQNTLVALEENDQIRYHAWQDYDNCGGQEIECDCGTMIELPPRPGNVRNALLKTILSAQEQRAKLYGLFGVKAEFYQQVQHIKTLQDKLLEFMRRELCPADRAKLLRFMEGHEDMVNLPAIPASSIEREA